MTQPLLSLRSVSKTFHVAGREVKAVDDVSFDVEQGECLAVVGESGSGKSTIANMILGIYPQTLGEIAFKGAALPAGRDLAHRRAIQLVQQNPLSSLNPRRTIGASLRLALDVHGIGERAARAERTGQLLEEVGLPADFRTRSPAALSGGQRQRVAIARATSMHPAVLLADEPTGNLDQTTGKEVMNLLEQLVEQKVALILVTHDPVLGGRAARQIHMVDGQIVSETGQSVGRAMPAETERRAESGLR